jgi:aminopeptidase N
VILLTALLGLALVPVRDSVNRWPGPGISHELAERRARQIHDVRYDIRVDLRQRDRATEHVTVRFERIGTGDVVLDFRASHLVGPVLANGAPAPGIVAARGHVLLPEAILRAGDNDVEFDVEAPIAPSGTSIIRFHDQKDGSDYLYTLLVPSDANALFPCFDQPDLKARVTLALTIPRGWTALANGALAAADSTDSATTLHFAESEPISTYLIAFAAGPWARFHSTAGARPITLYVRASRAKEVESDSIITLNARGLNWLERYFDRPFPFQKFDILLAPSFPFGGMEHPGAVFYNEETFIFRERPTLNQRLNRELTIFHEVTHQWFGDLVTMRWFDDLWLKEGFANYMAAVMQDALDPKAGAWMTFYLHNRPSAYAVDVTDGTTPLWQSLSNLDQAKSAYGPIVYNKAPAVIKQLDYLVGDTIFRNGLRSYLRDHAYGNATWHDLLNAISAAAHRPLGAWGRGYILRPGVPILEQRLRIRDGQIAKLVLVQHPARPLSGPQPWPAKLNVLLGSSNGPPISVPIELAGQQTTVPVAGQPAPTFVYANAGDFGYALVMLDPRSVEWLGQHIEEVDDRLLRAMLWGSLWDLVREARLSPTRYLTIVERQLPLERDEQIAAAVLARTSRAVEAYLPDTQRHAVTPVLERLLFGLISDTARTFSVRKASLDALLRTAQSASALDSLNRWMDRDSLAGAPLREPTRWSIVAALIARRAPQASGRLAQEIRRDTTTERARDQFIAEAASPDTSNKELYWHRYFADRALNEEWVTASLHAFNIPDQSALTLRYLGPALDTLPWIQRNRRIFFLSAWLDSFLDGQTSAAALRRVERYLDVHPHLPADLRQKVLQSSDELRRAVGIRAASGVGVDLPNRRRDLALAIWDGDVSQHWEMGLVQGHQRRTSMVCTRGDHGIGQARAMRRVEIATPQAALFRDGDVDSADLERMEESVEGLALAALPDPREKLGDDNRRGK